MILAIIRELLRERWSLAELAAHLGCSRRTIYRYIHAIGDAIGLEARRSHDGRHVRYRMTVASVDRALGLSHRRPTRRSP